MHSEAFHHRKTEKGISLLQASIALVVVGILIVPMMEIYKINQSERTRRENNTKLQDVIYAMNRYAQQHGKFPVPANPELTGASPPAAGYGQPAVGYTAATPCVDGGDGAQTNPIGGQTIDTVGIRCVINPHNVAADPGNTLPQNHEVLVGAVPFQLLGLSEKSSFDQFGGKITYAVTRRLTEQATFDNTKGAVGIRNQKPGDNPLLGGGEFDTVDATNRDRVLFALISHGKNHKGAYLRNGALSACPAGPELDTDNCNRAHPGDPAGYVDGVFRGMQSDVTDPVTGIVTHQLSQSYMLSDNGTANSFDDMVAFRTTSHDKYWSGLQNNADATESVFTSEPVKTAIRTPSTAPLTAADAPKAALDVAGNVQAYRLVTETICDAASGGCFRTENLTSPVGDGGTLNSGVRCTGDVGLFNLVPNAGNPTAQITRSWTQAQSAAFITRTCATTTDVPVSGPITPATCPNGMNGWSNTGSPVCIP